jgi:hypothetical protein
MSVGAVKKVHEIKLDFMLNYKPEAGGAAEHVMKNSFSMTENHWMVAGKLLTNHDKDTLLVLVRLLSYKNNKFNLQFMLIDSDEKQTYIAEPRMVAMSGLPVQLVKNEKGKSMQLSVLVNIVARQSS